MDSDLFEQKKDSETSGVMAYTPLLSRLERCADNAERDRVALKYLPANLLCALQDDNCLRDIIDVGEKYPRLLPYIYGIALGLRSNQKLKSWTEYESFNYKEFIAGIFDRLPKRKSE